jgi:hypothetical protein
MHRRLARTATLLSVAAVLVSGCGSDSDDTRAGPPTTAKSSTVEPVIDPGDAGDYEPVIDPGDFVDTIDNPYMPMLPGSRWVYEGTSDGETEHIEVVVTDERKMILGISATVVRDTVTIDGQLVEDTFDWFAQDHDGAVWYLGEATEEYEDGKVVSTEGAWEAGVDGALPGIVMPAEPAVGDAFRQEFYAGEAEDMAEVIAVGATEVVAGKPVTDLVTTRDWTPLDAGTIELKHYAPGIGLVLEEKVAGGVARVELRSFTAGR